MQKDFLGPLNFLFFIRAPYTLELSFLAYFLLRASVACSRTSDLFSRLNLVMPPSRLADVGGYALTLLWPKPRRLALVILLPKFIDGASDLSLLAVKVFEKVSVILAEPTRLLLCGSSSDGSN